MANHEKMRALYSQFVKQGDLCFDVGANIGNRTEVFLELGARVIAVEPQIDCAQQLEIKYAGYDIVTVVKKALGKQAGTLPMFISNINPISSLSSEWISSVRNSGRFSMFEWNSGTPVEITTLDTLIAQYGKPAFCKIDVEGYEYEVLQGLSQPIEALSFEFTPEILEPAVNCISYLNRLGDYCFNISLKESMELSLPEWVDIKEIINHLPFHSSDITLFGDIYARMKR